MKNNITIDREELKKALARVIRNNSDGTTLSEAMGNDDPKHWDLVGSAEDVVSEINALIDSLPCK